jgi:hypothetical protein
MDYTPIDALGNFSFTAWASNERFDPTSAALYIIAVPNTYTGAFPGAMAGMCDPVDGTPVAPETLPIFDAAISWAMLPRVNNITLTLDPIAGSPLMNAATDVTGTITGLPDVPSQFAALLFRREASGGLTGPLPGCTPATASALIAGTEPGTATFNITGWAGAVGTPAYTLNTQAELVLLLVPSAVVPGPGDAVCVTYALAGISIDAISLRLPAGVLGVRLGSVEVTRPLVKPIRVLGARNGRRNAQPCALLLRITRDTYPSCRARCRTADPSDPSGPNHVRVRFCLFVKVSARLHHSSTGGAASRVWCKRARRPVRRHARRPRARALRAGEQTLKAARLCGLRRSRAPYRVGRE